MSGILVGTDIYPWTPGVTHTIHFNVDYGSSLYWDPTPTTTDVPSASWDALSVADHELGHMFGFVPNFYYDNAFAANSVDKWTSHITGSTFDPNGLNVSMASPTNLGHVLDSGATAGDLMVPALLNGVRHDISDTDLNMLHMAYGYTVVPEPSTFALLAIGLFGVLIRARRRRP